MPHPNSCLLKALKISLRCQIVIRSPSGNGHVRMTAHTLSACICVRVFDVMTMNLMFIELLRNY